MKLLGSILNLVIALLFAGIQYAKAQPQFGNLPWNLVWEDDFGSNSLDPTKWCRNDWRAHYSNRHDLMAYRTNSTSNSPDNVEFHNDGIQSFVRQIVKKEQRTRNAFDLEAELWGPWTDQFSAPSWFFSKTKFKYGYFEARLRLPALNSIENNLGFGPNFWLWNNSPPLPDSGYPESEIDVVEFVCDFPPHTHTCNVHHKTLANKPGFHDLGSARLTPNDGQFHTYGAWWGPDFVKFYIDGVFYRDARAPIPDIADEMIPMRIILDINVFTARGNETPNAFTKLPYNYDIDYVRVYQLNQGQCGVDYVNCSPMPALPSVYKSITFGGSGCALPPNSTKSLVASTGITIQQEFTAPLGTELILDIYECAPNVIQSCSTCTSCD